MAIWDLLKSGKKKNVQPENTDEILELASKDISYRPLFYRSILDTKLYLLIHPDNTLPNGQVITDKNTQLKVKILPDGKVPVFTSTDKFYDNKVITEDEHYVAMICRDIFKMFKEPTDFWLNPYSRPSKIFLAKEVKDLLNDKLYQSYEEKKSEAGGIITIGEPANYPSILTESIITYCQTRVEINGAYLALTHDSATNEDPHLLLGLDTTGNIKQIYGELSEVIKPHLTINEAFDIFNISEGGQIAKTLKLDKYRIY